MEHYEIYSKEMQECLIQKSNLESFFYKLNCEILDTLDRCIVYLLALEIGYLAPHISTGEICLI